MSIQNQTIRRIPQSRDYEVFWGATANYTIYKIQCIKNDTVYIGCTLRYKKRIKQHISELIKKEHPNKSFQLDFNMYGSNCFLMMPIDTATKKSKSIVERYYINKYGEKGVVYNKNNKCKIKDRKLFNLVPLKYIKLMIEIGWNPST